MFSSSEFYLATTFGISCDKTIAATEIDGHKLIFFIIIVDYFNSFADIFIGNPDMPRPKYGTTCILDGNDGIALSNSLAVHRERYVAVACTVIFYISN